MVPLHVDKKSMDQIRQVLISHSKSKMLEYLQFQFTLIRSRLWVVDSNKGQSHSLGVRYCGALP